MSVLVAFGRFFSYMLYVSVEIWIEENIFKCSNVRPSSYAPQTVPTVPRNIL
jgi:hypothetical protein